MKPLIYRDTLRTQRKVGSSVFLLARSQIAVLIVLSFLLMIGLPLIVTSMFDSVRTLLFTMLGCALASTFGLLLLRGVRNYPGVEESFYTVPAFCVSYGMLIVVLVMARIPYSRLLLTTTFVVSMIVSIAIRAMLRRHITHRIGVVSEGDYDRLLAIPGVEWKLLDNPDAPIGDLDSVSVDLWCELSDEWERALASFALQGVPVYHSKHLLESLTGRVEVERLSENNFGTLSPLYAYMNIKHIADWIAALVAVIVLLPVLLLIGIVIKLDSAGPTIFRQTRIGYQGRPFWVLKFRTMTVAVEIATAGDGIGRDAAMTKDQDQRITRIGRFLRKSRLDELPQLINVLRGEMSWIGPRPEVEVLSRWYESEISFYRYRHIVRPGITGWAQVHQGHVADVAQVREKLNYDFYYIKNFSLWVDIIVVARTIRTMLTGFGSR